jgi:hypothetical protein
MIADPVMEANFPFCCLGLEIWSGVVDLKRHGKPPIVRCAGFRNICTVLRARIPALLATVCARTLFVRAQSLTLQ